MIIQGKGNSVKHVAMVQAPLLDTVTTLHSGAPVMLDAQGKLKPADGTTRAFVCFSDKNATYDNVKDHGGLATYGIGTAVVTVDENAFDSGETYAFGTRLVAAAGKWTPAVTPLTVDAEATVSAVALGPIVGGLLRIAQL